jgi:glycosyltransferase involved in cell wall biosynthesis
VSEPESTLSVSVTVPAYNEEVLLDESIRRQHRKLTALGVPFEIVVVDDGSTDRTGAIAAELSEALSGVRNVYLARNCGVGTAIWTGFRESRMEWVLANSVDEPLDLDDLRWILGRREGADVMVVARRDRSANPPFRKVTSKVNYWLIRLLFGVPIKDFQFVQIYRRAVLDRVSIKATDAFMPPELLLRTLRRGARVIEVETTFHPRRRGKSSYNDPRRYVRALAEMVRFRWELGRNQGQIPNADLKGSVPPSD